MSTLDTVKIDLAKYGEPVLVALSMAQALTGLGGEQAAAGLAAIKAALDTLAAGIAADATPNQILADLGKLDAGIAADDAAADAALTARFPAGGRS